MSPSARESRLYRPADFKYWSGMPTWTIHEAAALWTGCDPKAIDESVMVRREERDPLAKIYCGYRRFLIRGKKQLRIYPNSRPELVARFAEECGQPLPTELTSLIGFTEIGAIPPSLADQATDATRLNQLQKETDDAHVEVKPLRALNPKSARAAARIIRGLIKSLYPKKFEKELSAAEVHRKLANSGVYVDRKVVGLWLKEARNVGDGNEPEQPLDETDDAD